MKSQHHPINTASTPVVFTDGSAVYAKLAQTYSQHNHGRFILAPSGSGKTHFVNGQTVKDWIDGDLLWVVTGADYSGDEWNQDLSEVMEINARCDAITQQAKKQGFWVIGSSNLYLQPDAVVIPDWETQQHYISLREKNDYDGGATASDIDGLKAHINWITSTWKGVVPFFESIEQAVDYLEAKSK